MRLLVANFGDVRVFKEIDPDVGFRYTTVLSGIWYKKEKAIKIAMEKQNKLK